MDPEPAVRTRKIKTTQAALARSLVNDTHPLVLLIDLDHVRFAIDSLHSAFNAVGPHNHASRLSLPHFVHCLAVKSNPTLRLLQFAAKHAMGLEAASLGELTQALRTGINPDRIVFDSPVKTAAEIKFALQNNITLNLDNFAELAKVAEFAASPEFSASTFRIGLRINPQGASGSLEAFSTGTRTSKFGIGLIDSEQQIIDAYVKYPWLNAIHIHVGSQGIPMELMASGIRRMMDLVAKIHTLLGRQQITTVDIGGGLSVNFASEQITPTFHQLAQCLYEQIPELFSGHYRVLTEFGRSIVAKAGWMVSKVEYSKITGGRQIVLQHAGADICVRTVYSPDKWPLRVTILDSRGEPKETDGAGAPLVETDIAGPCCFAGDIVAHKRMLPPMQSNDLVLLHDVGGYYHSSYSKYNLRQSPPVYGCWVKRSTDAVLAGDSDEITRPTTVDGEIMFTLLQRAETVEETLRMFTLEQDEWASNELP